MASLGLLSLLVRLMALSAPILVYDGRMHRMFAFRGYRVYGIRAPVIFNQNLYNICYTKIKQTTLRKKRVMVKPLQTYANSVKQNFEIFNSSRIFGELVKMIAVIKFWIVTILIQITTRLDSSSKNSKSGLISTVLSFSDVFHFRWAIFLSFGST